MSSRGRRRQSPAPVSAARAGPAQLGWALLVIAAAMIGGLAAATLVNASVVVALIVSVVVGAIGVVALFRSPTAPGSRAARSASSPPDPAAPSSPPDPVAPSVAPPTAAGPAVRDGPGRGDPPAPGETVVQLLPLPSQPGGPDAPWWDSAQGTPPSPSAGAKRAPAPDLSTYLTATFIAQCPRCGGFWLDIRPGRNAWDVRCESCEYTWTWPPGTAWPPVRVMPP